MNEPVEMESASWLLAKETAETNIHLMESLAANARRKTELLKTERFYLAHESNLFAAQNMYVVKKVEYTYDEVQDDGYSPWYMENQPRYQGRTSFQGDQFFKEEQVFKKDREEENTNPFLMTEVVSLNLKENLDHIGVPSSNTNDSINYFLCFF
jgi:hypothetical protein